MGESRRVDLERWMETFVRVDNWRLYIPSFPSRLISINDIIFRVLYVFCMYILYVVGGEFMIGVFDFKSN